MTDLDGGGDDSYGEISCTIACGSFLPIAFSLVDLVSRDEDKAVRLHSSSPGSYAAIAERRT